MGPPGSFGQPGDVGEKVCQFLYRNALRHIMYALLNLYKTCVTFPFFSRAIKSSYFIKFRSIKFAKK